MVATFSDSPKNKYRAIFGAAQKRSDRMAPLHRKVTGGRRCRGRPDVCGSVRRRHFLVHPIATSHHEDRTSRKGKRVPPKPITCAYHPRPRSRDDKWEVEQRRAHSRKI